jgi:hypothetical protein
MTAPKNRRRAFLMSLAVVSVLVVSWRLVTPSSGPTTPREGVSADREDMRSAATRPAQTYRPIARSAFPANVESRASLGQLELFFRDHTDASVSGVRVAVLRDSATSSESTLTSASTGVVTWDLAPGTYRWVRLGGPEVEVSPQHEDKETWVEVRRGSGVGWTKAGRRPPPNLSGRVEVRVGQTTCIDVLTYTGNGIIGSLPVGGPIESGEFRPWTMVQLARRTIKPSSNGPSDDLVLDDHVNTTVVGPGGGFRFLGVSAGTYIVHAHWRIADEFFFVRRIFEAAPGVITNLGVLLASGDPTMLTIVAVEHAGNATLETPPSASVKLRLMNVDPTASDADNMATFFDAPVGVPLRLIGLSKHLWQTTVVEIPDWAVRLKAKPKLEYVRFQHGDLVRYEFTTAPDPVKFNVQVRSTERPWIYFSLVPTRGAGSIEANASPARWQEGRVEELMEAPAGDYHLFVHTQRVSKLAAAQGSTPSNLCGYLRVALPGSDPRVIVDLSPGDTFAGTLVDETGSALIGKTVFLRPKGIEPWIYSATTDASGRFLVQGLPREFAFEAMQAVGEITPNGSGALVMKRRQ